MTVLLEKEYKFFLGHRRRLVKEHLHKFILIKDDRIVGFYDSYDRALKAGLKDFGNVPFFIKEIERHEEVHFLQR